MNFVDAIAISALMVLTTITVVWYFRMRRRMLRFLKDFTVKLEEILKPRDKEYHLLGYLVGYKALFKLSDGSRVYVLLTTTPRHSLIYYIVARALKREDRVTIALEPSRRKVIKEVHAVRDGEAKLKYVLNRDLGDELSKLSVSKVNTRWGYYEIYYEDPKDVDMLLSIINDEKSPYIKHQRIGS